MGEDDTKKLPFQLSNDERKSLVLSLIKAVALHDNLLKNPDYLAMAQSIGKIPLKSLFDQSVKLTNSLTPLTIVPIKKDVIQIRESVVRVLKSEQKEIEVEKIESEEQYQEYKSELEKLSEKIAGIIATQESHGKKLDDIKSDSEDIKQKAEDIEENTRPSTMLAVSFGVAFLVGVFFFVLYLQGF